jgi:hypothetical protein
MKKIFIPDSVDMMSLSAKAKGVISPYKEEKLAYIMHAIIYRHAIRKDSKLDDDYIPLSGAILKDVLGNNYLDYKSFLQKEGIIESDGQYYPGKSSMGYRITKQHEGKIKRYEVKDMVTARNISKVEVVNVDTTDPNYNSGIYNWYTDGKLRVDSSLAKEYTEVIYTYKNSDEERWDVERLPNGTKNRKNPYFQYANMTINIEKIVEGEFNAHFDQKVYRFHSVLTNCKKELRHALEYDGEQLVAVDLCNSQPYLSSVLFKEDFWDGKGKFSISNLPITSSSIFPSPSSLLSNSNLLSFIMILKIHSGTGSGKGSKDLEEYIEAVSKGSFYEDFQKSVKDKLKKELKRDEIKKTMFTVLFTGNQYSGQRKADKKRLFKKTFPSVYEIFSQIKKSKKQNLAILLQQIESYIFTQRIALRLTTDYPTIPFWTIHDSVVTTKTHIELVEKIVREELLDCIGLPPTLKREYWDKKVLQKEIDRIKAIK